MADEPNDPVMSQKGFYWFLFSWPVLGPIAGVLVSFGGGLMLSPHPYIADGFCIAGLLIVLIKFWCWDLSKHDTTRKIGALLAGGSLFILALMVGVCWLNNYLNPPKQTLVAIPQQSPPPRAPSPSHVEQATPALTSKRSPKQLDHSTNNKPYNQKPHHPFPPSQPIQTPFQSSNMDKQLSGADFAEAAKRPGPFFSNITTDSGGTGGVGILDANPCQHTMVNVHTYGGAPETPGFVHDPRGVCLSKSDLVKDKQLGRRISAEDKASLVMYLEQIKGRVRFLFFSGDEECHKFSTDWYEVFKSAQWKMEDTEAISGDDIKPVTDFASGVAASLPGEKPCVPRDDKDIPGRAMYAISARTGMVGTSCSSDPKSDLITVFIGPRTY